MSVKYTMASSSYNVLLAAAALPDASRSRQVVVGTADDVVFFGGAGVGANGASAGASGAALLGGATLALGATGGAGGGPGVTGQVLTSGGAGVTPFWGNFTFTITPTVGSAYPLRAPFAPLYVFDGAATGWAVALPDVAPGARFWLKNYAGAGSVSTAVVPVGGTTAFAGLSISTGLSAQFVCDAARWYVVAASAPPSAPAAPTSVAISNPTQASMTVSWDAPTDWGGFVADYYTISIYQGSGQYLERVQQSYLQPTSLQISRSGGGTFDFSSATPFTATVTAVNTGLLASTGTSAPYSLPNSQPPTNVTITNSQSPRSPTATSMQVNWVAPVWGVQGPGSYTVTIYQGSSAVATAPASTAATTATLSGAFDLSNQTPFTATVTAVNGWGQAPVTGTSIGYSWAIGEGAVTITTPSSYGAPSVTVNWSGFAAGLAPIQDYAIALLQNGVEKSSATAYSNSNSVDVGTYGFDLLSGAWSARVTATTAFGSSRNATSISYNWGPTNLSVATTINDYDGSPYVTWVPVPPAPPGAPPNAITNQMVVAWTPGAAATQTITAVGVTVNIFGNPPVTTWTYTDLYTVTVPAGASSYTFVGDNSFGGNFTKYDGACFKVAVGGHTVQSQTYSIIHVYGEVGF